MEKCLRNLSLLVLLTTISESLRFELSTVHRYGVTNGETIEQDNSLGITSCYFFCWKNENCDFVIFTSDKICIKKKFISVITIENPLILINNNKYFSIFRKVNQNISGEIYKKFNFRKKQRNGLFCLEAHLIQKLD